MNTIGYFTIIAIVITVAEMNLRSVSLSQAATNVIPWLAAAMIVITVAIRITVPKKIKWYPIISGRLPLRSHIASIQTVGDGSLRFPQESTGFTYSFFIRIDSEDLSLMDSVVVLSRGEGKIVCPEISFEGAMTKCIVRMSTRDSALWGGGMKAEEPTKVTFPIEPIRDRFASKQFVHFILTLKRDNQRSTLLLYIDSQKVGAAIVEDTIIFNQGRIHLLQCDTVRPEGILANVLYAPEPLDTVPTMDVPKDLLYHIGTL